MRDVCSLIWLALIGLFRSRASLQAEILTSRHQLNVLRRKSPQRITFTSIDRLVFAGLYRLAPGVLDALKIVRPETVIRWHRAGFRVYWRTPAAIADPASLGVLASNLKTVWDAPTTDARLKKRIVRTLVHEVVADIDDAASEIVLIVHWVGGAHSELRLPKRRRGQRNSTSADIIQTVRQLVLITSDDLIASLLNRNGLKTGNGNRWTRERVTSLRSYHHIPVFKPADDGIEPWLNLGNAAKLLKIAPKTLRLAAERS